MVCLYLINYYEKQKIFKKKQTIIFKSASYLATYLPTWECTSIYVAIWGGVHFLSA